MIKAMLQNKYTYVSQFLTLFCRWWEREIRSKEFYPAPYPYQVFSIWCFSTLALFHEQWNKVGPYSNHHLQCTLHLL